MHGSLPSGHGLSPALEASTAFMAIACLWGWEPRGWEGLPRLPHRDMPSGSVYSLGLQADWTFYKKYCAQGWPQLYSSETPNSLKQSRMPPGAWGIDAGPELKGLWETVTKVIF